VTPVVQTDEVMSGRLARGLLGCGLAAGPLFTCAYLLEGGSRADYSAWRHPVSSLALGRQGWVQVANFLTTGALLLAFGVGWRCAGERSKWLPRLVGSIGAGLIGAGVFACDPVGGYPPGTPLRRQRPSLRGALHQAFSALVFLGMPAMFAIEARKDHSRWSAYSTLTCLGFVGTFAASSAGFGQVPGLARRGGAFQRVALTIGFTWLSLRAARLLQQLPKG
jgi:hypothetical protein